MFPALAVVNSTSNSSPISDWLTPTGIGTIVLSLGVFFAAIEILLDRRDRRMDREREIEERPHFRLARVVLHVQDFHLLWDEGAKAAPSSLRIGIVKAIVENIGETMAEGVVPFFRIGKPRDPTLLQSVFAALVETPDPFPLKVPNYVGKSADELGDYLLYNIFGDKTIHEQKRDVPPSGLAAAVCIFTVEGSDKALHSNPNVEGFKLPLDTTFDLRMVMDNAPQSVVAKGRRLVLRSWNEMEPS
jgi:hypothetical protein